MTPGWLPVDPLPADLFRRVRRRAIFDCFKWDPQMEDVSILSPVPILLEPGCWAELTRLAEALAAEAAAAEAELCERPALISRLGLPRRVARMIDRGLRAGAPRGIARLARFDFHLTTEGWRISEANTDVPGGLNEAAGYTALVASHYPGTVAAGDPVGSYASALVAGCERGAGVALVHATAFTEDHQVMRCVAAELERQGARPILISPSHVRWQEGGASVASRWSSGSIDRAVRFFPGEWLANLPAASRPEAFVSHPATWLSNPATALLTQSKRFPLVWDDLRTSLPAWRACLPETRDPREVRWRGEDAWVLKPALGRVGEGIVIAGITPAAERARLEASARRHPGQWVAQRRFDPVPFRAGVDCGGEALHPCIGVFTVNGRAAGAYGRLAARPLVDWRAMDAAVLIDRRHDGTGGSN